MYSREIPSPGSEILSLRYKDIEYIDRVLEETRAFAYESGIAQTEWGQAALWYATTQATILRPDLRGPTPLRHSGMLEKTGGPDHNPTRAIDTVGSTVMQRIMGSISTPALVYIEEEKRWLPFNRGSPGIPVSITVDPLDETGPIRIGLRVQATAVTFADRFGEFIAGTIASLVDDELVLIEDGRVMTMRFYETSRGSTRRSTIEPLARAAPEFRSVENARIATLPRRMHELQRLPMFRDREYLPTFGGYGLLEMIRGNIDIMLDPFKGQPWYEAVHWGPMAERAGLVVSDPLGMGIDFSNILSRAMHAEEVGRVKMVISAHPLLHEQVLQGLRIGLEEGVI